MEWTWALGKLIGGFAILIFGGEALVAAAVSIASRLKISPAVVGLTIIAAGTSAPELLTTIIAAFNGTPDIAVGNVIGSNIFNILVILGVSALFVRVKAPASIVKRELPLLIGSTALFVLMIINAKLSRFEGAILLVGLNAFFFYSIREANKSKTKSSDEALHQLKNYYYDAGYLTVGFLALVGGANLALEGGITLGEMAGLTQRVIGITIISAGTGLPELATSAVAAYRGRNDIAVANVIGSNIINTLGVTGVAATSIPIAVQKDLAHSDSLILLGITICLLPLLKFRKNELGKVSGTILLLAYIGYVTMLLWR